MKKYSKYDIKCCPMCKSKFECKPDNISQCQCSEIIPSSDEQMFISDKYDDCLCADCLLEMKKIYCDSK